MDAEPGDNVVTAENVRTLGINGDRRENIDGDFAATLMLTGSNDPRVRDTLSRARITGDVSGTTWTVAGTATNVQIDGVIDGGWTLNVTNGDVRSLRLGEVLDADVTVGGNVQNAQATRWVDGSLIANTVRSLRSTGDRRTGLDGNFGAALQLAGDPAERSTLNAATIAGTLSGTWSIIGPVGNVRADAVGDADPQGDVFTGIISGELRGFSSNASFENSTLVAHVITRFDVRENLFDSTIAAAGDFATEGITETSIGSFSVRGEVMASTLEETRVMVGVDFVNGDFFDGFDLVGGEAHSISRITVNGDADENVRFKAGEFPRVSMINRERIDDYAADVRFELTEV
jgi:hypothetical protein